jgi:hypothetical protein
VQLSLGLPLFLEVAQPGQSSRLGTEAPLVRIQPSRPNIGECSLMAKPQAVTQGDIGSSPIVHPKLYLSVAKLNKAPDYESGDMGV